MSTLAFIGSQTLLQVGNGASPEVFTTIAEVTSVDPIAVKKDLVEVTHLQSTAKEFIGGLSDGQMINFTCNYIPANSQQNSLWISANTVSASRNFKYIMPSGGGGLAFTFAGLVLEAGVGPTTPNTATQITYGIKVVSSIAGPS